MIRSGQPGKLLLLGAATALAVAGCARREAPPSAPPVQPVPSPARPAAPAQSPADYVARAGSIDLFVIRSSELLLARSQDARLRAFAQSMIRQHEGTAGQLSLAGRRLNLLPSVTLRPEHQAMMRQLERSPAIGPAFLQFQFLVHEEAIGLHQAFAERGNSPTLRPVAAAALAIERRHLQDLRRLR